MPILVGGHSERAAAGRPHRRRLDGRVLPLDELAGYVDRLQAFRHEYGTADRPFEIQASIIDRAAHARRVRRAGGRWASTTLITSAWLMEGLQFASLDENVRALERFGEQYIAPLRGI